MRSRVLLPVAGGKLKEPQGSFASTVQMVRAVAPHLPVVARSCTNLKLPLFIFPAGFGRTLESLQPSDTPYLPYLSTYMHNPHNASTQLEIISLGSACTSSYR